jgi:hypothetical protein
VSDAIAAGHLAVEFHQLFPNGDAAGRALSVPLPPGRIVRGDEGDSDLAALWLSDEPAPDGLWARLRAEHSRSGLWPLLLRPLSDEPSRPWEDGELWPDDMSSPDEHDPEALLAQWWQDNTVTDPEQDDLSPAERLAITAPYGQHWPGLAPSAKRDDPDRVADTLAAELPTFGGTWRLGLVATDRGADALTIAGWIGPVNYTNDTAELSAVLRSWEERFGARVVGAGFADLYLSVAAPPRNREEALPIAAEHFAFCPDNIWQGSETLEAYADGLVEANAWVFWWD